MRVPKARCSQKRALGPALPADTAPAQRPEQPLVGQDRGVPWEVALEVSGMGFVHLVARGCGQKQPPG